MVIRSRTRPHSWGPEKRHPQFTAHDLGKLKFKPLTFICEPIIAPGATLIAGKPKVGKSWLALDIALAVASGSRACAKWATDQGDVLFFALEDNKRRLHGRMSKLRPADDWPSSLTFATRADLMGGGFEEAVQRWAAECDKRPKLVVVDTLRYIRPVRADRVSYQSDYADAAALTALAKSLKIALVAVHHLRKLDAEDPLDGISGTTGLAAGFDTVLALTRSTNGLLKLAGRGRDISPVQVALSFDAETAAWAVEGEPALAQASEQRKAIIAYLRANGEAGPRQIADGASVDYDVTRQLLGAMVAEGLVCKPGRGTYLVPDKID